MNNLILASGSPRRKQLLAEMGETFTQIPSQAEELHDASIPLRELCEQNAYLKAADVAQHHPGHIVIGADTLVFLDKTPIGKPTSKANAIATLKWLSGQRHSVCTGISLVYKYQGKDGKDSDGMDDKEGILLTKRILFSEVTYVQFKPLSEQTILEYMEKVNVMDKAGSYALQDHADMIVDSTEGDYSNVVGLPQSKLAIKLAEFRTLITAV